MNTSVRLDAVFHALADPTRRAMLAQLAKTERTAGELGAPFEMSQPSASKHIRVLEQAGLVTRSVTGRRHTLRFVPGPLRDAEAWMARHRQFWEGALGRLDTVLADLQRHG